MSASDSQTGEWLTSDEITGLHKQIGKGNYAKMHQELTKMQVADDTGVMQTQTPDNWQGKVKNMPDSAAQTAGWEEIKKKVLLELGMSEDLADACIEFPEELCHELRGFTEKHMPSSSYERIGAAPMEGDSDDHSEVSTSSTGRGEEAEDEWQDDEQEEEPANVDEIHEDGPGDSQESADAASKPVKPVGSVNPRFTQDKLVDFYWQQVLEQHQQGKAVYTQEDLQLYRNAHPIARALAEGDSHLFGPQTQAATASL